MTRIPQEIIQEDGLAPWQAQEVLKFRSIVAENTTIQFYVNGQQVNASARPDLTLLDVLRNQLGMLSPKNGCSSGHCGTCTVIFNGKATRSCLVKMKTKRMQDAKVETVEGLSTPGNLHPLQAAFIEEGAVQCGFCTPGLLMAAKALVDHNPNPSPAEIREALTKNHNLCRCTGYKQIIDAIQKGAARMASGIREIPIESLQHLETEDSTRLFSDAVDLVTGKTRFGDDIQINQALVGKILWSEHPHAEILSIDTSEAESLEGVSLVITAADIPGENIAGIIELDQPAIAEDKVRFIGDPVAAVFAVSEHVAETALDKIKVDYRPLPAVFDPIQASSLGAPLVHESGNLMHEASIERGDVEAAFDQCAVIEENIFITPRVEHAFLEVENGIGVPDKDGGVTIMMGTQCAFDDRQQIARILGLPERKVRVVQLPMGGAFGGKEDILIYQFLALGAYLSRRKVRISLSRKESLRTHVKRHPATMEYRVGADKDGKLLAIEANITLDAGAYASLTTDVLENAVVFSGGPYFFPHVRVNGKAWYTNTVPSGAMRGFGVNQVTFAMESVLDEIARELRLDPFEIRLINGLEAGFPTISDHILEEGIIGYKDTVIAARDQLWKMNIPDPRPGKKIGVGVASAVKNFGYGHGLKETCGADVTLKSTGEVIVGISQHEMGQGSRAGLVRLAADALGISPQKITLLWPDTGITPPTGPTTASRQTFLTGNALIQACCQLREELFHRAADELGIQPDRLTFEDDRIVDYETGASLVLEKLGDEFSTKGSYEPPKSFPLLKNEKSHFGESDFRSRPTHCGYSYGTHVAIVEVDESRGTVEVLSVIAAHDLGKVINRPAAEGQLYGGVVQGLGYALSEEFVVEEGINLTDSLLKCGVPLAEQTPEMIPLFIEVPHQEGPYGAKGFAEAPSLPTAPAITNAIRDAVDVRVTTLPATKEQLIQLRKDKVE